MQKNCEKTDNLNAILSNMKYVQIQEFVKINICEM